MVATITLKEGSQYFTSFYNSTVFVDIAQLGANVHDHLVQHTLPGVRVSWTNIRPKPLPNDVRGSKHVWEFASVVFVPQRKHPLIVTGLLFRDITIDVDRGVTLFNKLHQNA